MRVNNYLGMKRICLLIDALKIGGKERVMSELATYFSSKPDIEVHLTIYGSSRTICYPLPDSVIIHIPKFEFDSSRRLIYAIQSLRFLRRKIKLLKPDSVLSFGEIWNSFVLLALYGLKTPVYISDRCQPDRKYKKIHIFLRKWLYPKASGIIAQTEIAREIYKNQFRNTNIKVIGNPIRRIYTDATVSKRENIVLSVGRLITTKNHQTLIELFNNINKPGWKLCIIGGDAQKQQLFEGLSELIKSLNAEDSIFLLGEQNDVDKFYLKSKIYASMSSSEGFPNVIGEALTSGLPVIAFDCIAGPSGTIELKFWDMNNHTIR